MTDFILKQLPYDLSNQTGLALISKCLKRININSLVDPAFPVRRRVPNSDILKMLPCGYMPLDVTTFAMDNSGTAKEHVGRTYVGVDGYCPWVAYLGTQGFCLELALRPGTQHSASETEYKIERVLPLAVKLTQSQAAAAATDAGASGRGAPLLFRADSGFDSAKLMCAIGKQALAVTRQIAFIIKWNPRTTSVETVTKDKTSDASTPWTQLREGKRQCLWAQGLEIKHAVMGWPWLR